MIRLVKFDRLVEDDHQQTAVRPIDDRMFTDPRDLHRAVCFAFSLDPIRTRLDVPGTWRGTGSDRGDGAARGRQDGLVLFHDGNDFKPIGKIAIMRTADKVHDVDCLDPRDFYDMNRPQ